MIMLKICHNIEVKVDKDLKKYFSSSYYSNLYGRPGRNYKKIYIWLFYIRDKIYCKHKCVLTFSINCCCLSALAFSIN